MPDDAQTRGWGLPAVAAGWSVAVVALWMVLGWRLQVVESPFPWRVLAEFPSAQLAALIAATAHAALALGWGALATRWAPALLVSARQPLVRLAVRLLLGQILMALLTLAVGLAGLLPWGLVVLLFGAAGWRWGLRDSCNEVSGLASRLSAQARLGLMLAAIPVALSLVLALAPAEESDGLRYHLFGPQEYLKAGAIRTLPHHAFTNLPFQQHMHHVAVMAVADPRAAQVVHWLNLLPIMVLGGALGRATSRAIAATRQQSRSSHQLAAVGAGGLAISLPVTLTIAGWPNVDLATLAYLLAMMVVVLPGGLPTLRGRALLAGLMGGAAIGTKLTALVPVAFVSLVLLAMVWHARRSLTLVVVHALAIAAVCGPWFVKNTVALGNPVYPAAWGVFGGGYWSEFADALYRDRSGQKGFGKSPTDFVLSPLDVTVRWQATRESPPESLADRLLGRASPGYEDHNPGPAPLALLPVAIGVVGWLLLRRPRAALAWMLALQIAGGWVFWFLSYQSVRFALLPLTLVVVVGGAGLLAMARDHAARAVALVTCLVLGTAGASWHLLYGTVGNPKRPLVAALAGVERDDYLGTLLNFHEAVQWLNAECEPGEAVGYIGEHRGLYARYPLHSADWFDDPWVLHEIRTTPNNDAMLASWNARGIRYVLWNQQELGLYEAFAFQPRFADDEWRRFVALRERLLDSDAIAFRSRPMIFVIDLKKL